MEEPTSLVLAGFFFCMREYLDCLRDSLGHVKLNKGFIGVDVMDLIIDLAYRLVGEYGLSVAFLVLYPITLIYVLTLRYKEQQKTLQVINELINSNNLLGGEVHQAMQISNSIVAACIYAIGGNKSEAITILADVVKDNSHSRQEGE